MQKSVSCLNSRGQRIQKNSGKEGNAKKLPPFCTNHTPLKALWNTQPLETCLQGMIPQDGSGSTPPARCLHLDERTVRLRCVVFFYSVLGIRHKSRTHIMCALLHVSSGPSAHRTRPHAHCHLLTPPVLLSAGPITLSPSPPFKTASLRRAAPSLSPSSLCSISPPSQTARELPHPFKTLSVTSDLHGGNGWNAQVTAR